MLEPGGGGGSAVTSGDGLVCPAAFPAKSADLHTGKIRESADALRTMGRQVLARVEGIDGSWGHMQSCYEAPEEHRVYTVLDPAVSSARDLQGTLRRAAHHLDTYASELDRVKPRLETLESEAQEFRSRVVGGVSVDASEAADPSFGDHVVGAIDSVYGAMPRLGPIGDHVEERQVIVPWDQDTATYEENNALVARYNQMYEEISTAAVSCANSINGLVEGRTPTELDPVPAEALSVPGKPMPWGHPVDEERNCPESVGHGTKRGASNVKDAGVGLATLAVGYNPDTHGLLDRDYQGQAWAGLASASFSTAVTVAASKAPVLQDHEWVRRHEDVVKSTYGEEVGYDHQAEMAGGDGLHQWHDDPLAMGTTMALSVVPALLTDGVGLGVKGAATAGKVAPDGMKRPTRSTGDVLAALRRGDGTGRGAAGGPMKGATPVFPSGALGGKAVNTLDAALDGRGGAVAAPDGHRPPSGTRASVYRPGTYEDGHPPATIPAKEAGRRYTPEDVQRALDGAPQNEWGDPVDPRNGRPLLLENVNGDRGWEMRWDPAGEAWVAENRGLGQHGFPAKGEPGSYGYDANGDRLPYANHRPEYAPGQVEEVWRLTREAQLREIDHGLLPLPRPGSEHQMWVRVRDTADGSDLVDLGERQGKWRLIEWDPESPRDGVWDMGHDSRAKYADLHDRYMKGEMSTEKFLNAYRDPKNYQVQDPGRNRAHDDE